MCEPFNDSDMTQKPSTPASQAANPSTHERPGDHRQASQSEALHVRSYDHQWAYDLEVELLAADGVGVPQAVLPVPQPHRKRGQRHPQR